jgi:hypothetical protein
MAPDPKLSGAFATSSLRSNGIPKSIQDGLDASKAEYRSLGTSGLRVSVPILGCMSYGTSEWMDWVLDEDKVSVCKRLLSI